VLTADLSTVSAFADLVLHLGERLLHLDFQSGQDARLPSRVLRYNVLLYDQYGLPVESTVVLLCRKADRRDLTGEVGYAAADGRPVLNFRFEVLRLWQRPAEGLLSGGVGLVPLAVLGALPEGGDEADALRGVIERVVQRLTSELPQPQARQLVTAAYYLTGLRVPRNEATRMFLGVRNMRDSSTFQMTLDEGRVLGLHEAVRRLGTRRFGPPDEATSTVLQGITDIERLYRISERTLEASSWGDLLETP
jgi:hypothetical protein